MDTLPFSFYSNIAIYSTFNIIFGLYSHFIKEKLFISESLVSMLFGLVLGPAGFGLIFPSENEIGKGELWDFFHLLARFVMTFQTMAAGISLPRYHNNYTNHHLIIILHCRAYLAKKWRHLFILLGPVMLSMWIISTLIIYIVFNSTFNFLESSVLAACITPTDPILASSIVKGRFAEEHIPEHVRDLLSAER